MVPRLYRALLVALVFAVMVLPAASGLAGPGEETEWLTSRTPGFDLQAPGAVLMDGTSGQVIFAKGADEPRAPASLTKLMTLVLVFDALKAGRIGMDDVVVASERAKQMGGSTILLDTNEKIALEDLLKGVAISSGNDASVALAEHIAGSEAAFVAMMNDKATSLGMENSHFVNCHGIDAPGHVMSPMDVAILAHYAIQNHPELLAYTSIYDGGFLRPGTKEEFWLVNTNKLVRFYPGADGLKTGSTNQAKYCVAATAQREKTRMIAVIMGAPNSTTRFAEARQLMDYGFANYVTIPVVQAGEVVQAGVPVAKGSPATVDVVAARDLLVTIEKGREQAIGEAQVEMAPLCPPLRDDSVVGSLLVTDDAGNLLGKVDLVPCQDVRRASLPSMITRVLGWLFPFVR
jgi:D-alanyl-D-alanine carboxypeptidase (penicillin-binding protein 5/6)